MGKINYVKDTFAEYLGKKDHISASDIKNFLKSPQYYYEKKYNGLKESKEGRHFLIGSATHEAIMEAHQFHLNYCVCPKVDRRTADGKKEFADFERANKGKQVLLEDEMNMIIQMAESALRNNTLTELIRDSYRELSAYTIDEKTGLKLKMRPDIMSKKHSTIVDIKTCVESSPRAFKGDVYSYKYGLSDAFYSAFLERENYVFCAIEKSAPFQVALYQISDEMKDYGVKLMRMGLDLLKWSYDNNFFCNYNEFEILKDCYELDNLDKFFELNELSNKITILR